MNYIVNGFTCEIIEKPALFGKAVNVVHDQRKRGYGSVAVVSPTKDSYRAKAAFPHLGTGVDREQAGRQLAISVIYPLKKVYSSLASSVGLGDSNIVARAMENMEAQFWETYENGTAPKTSEGFSHIVDRLGAYIFFAALAERTSAAEIIRINDQEITARRLINDGHAVVVPGYSKTEKDFEPEVRRVGGILNAEVKIWTPGKSGIEESKNLWGNWTS